MGDSEKKPAEWGVRERRKRGPSNRVLCFAPYFSRSLTCSHYRSITWDSVLWAVCSTLDTLTINL